MFFILLYAGLGHVQMSLQIRVSLPGWVCVSGGAMRQAALKSLFRECGICCPVSKALSYLRRCRMRPSSCSLLPHCSLCHPGKSQTPKPVIPPNVSEPVSEPALLRSYQATLMCLLRCNSSRECRMFHHETRIGEHMSIEIST